MQTFLPLSSFKASASVLDRQRLGKQRVEAKQILNTLLGFSEGWRNHPAVRMWRGYEYALAEYGLAVCQEWKSRGYSDSLELFFSDMMCGLDDTGKPPWFGNEAFHASHRSNLVRKMPEHYRPLWSDVPDDLPYVWPVHGPLHL